MTVRVNCETKYDRPGMDKIKETAAPQYCEQHQLNVSVET